MTDGDCDAGLRLEVLTEAPSSAQLSLTIRSLMPKRQLSEGTDRTAVSKSGVWWLVGAFLPKHRSYCHSNVVEAVRLRMGEHELGAGSLSVRG